MTNENDITDRITWLLYSAQVLVKNILIRIGNKAHIYINNLFLLILVWLEPQRIIAVHDMRQITILHLIYKTKYRYC